MKDHREVLIAPVVSEKSYGLLDQNKYTFIVAPDANAIVQIAAGDRIDIFGGPVS